MDWLLNPLVGVGQDLILDVVLALIGLAAAFAITYIKRAASYLEAKSDIELVDATIARAAAFAESTVLSLESTVAKELREAVKDGRATRDELLAIGDKAVADVLQHLGEEGRAVLEYAVGNAADYIRDLIEAQVEKLKQVPFGGSPSDSGASTQGA